MTKNQTFSNEELTAYLDGEAPSEVARRIDLALGTNAKLKIQLESLSLDRAALKSAFEGLLQAAPQYPIEHQAAANVAPASSNLLKYAAVAALFAVMGWAGAYGLFQSKAATWQQQAAIYHSLYVNATLTNVNPSAIDMETELARVTAAVGKDISLDDLKRVSEFEYKRTQILGFDGRPLMQVSYLSRLGTPVVLCILRSKATLTSDVKTETMQGMAAATWSKGAFEYLLIGGNDRDLIERAAKTFAAVL
jgi:anti-sigma factor RsiW